MDKIHPGTYEKAKKLADIAETLTPEDIIEAAVDIYVKLMVFTTPQKRKRIMDAIKKDYKEFQNDSESDSK